MIAESLLYLLPDAKFTVRGDDYAQIVWMDARPLPSQAECEAAWPLVQARDAAAAQATSTANTNGANLKAAIAGWQVDHRNYRNTPTPTVAQRKAWEDKAASNLIALNRFLLNDLSGTA